MLLSPFLSAATANNTPEGCVTFAPRTVVDSRVYEVSALSRMLRLLECAVNVSGSNFCNVCRLAWAEMWVLSIVVGVEV